jgi:hypothetical protein
VTRFAMLATLAALPFAVAAAPVPEPPAPKPFGPTGIVSRAELDALKFDSRAVPEKERKGDRVERIKRVVDIQKRVQVADKEEGPQKVRPANAYDVGVHLPAVRFQVGDPIVAYFVVRNNRDEELDLDGRLEFDGGAPLVCNDTDLRLIDVRTGKAPTEQLHRIIKCGGRDQLVIPADGFYCAKGDLGPLPAGEYQLDWRCGEFRSAPVRFRVFDRDGPARPVVRAERLGYAFFRLGEDHERERQEFDSADTRGPVRQFVALDELNPREFAAALASGSASDSAAFVPDVRDIPSRDQHVLVSVDWHPYRSGDRIAVTLRAAPPFETVRFEELPHLFLQVEVPGAARARARELVRAWSKKLEPINNFVTPLTIEAHFPEDWRVALGSGETARVAVVVTSREPQLPYEGLRKAFEKVKFADHPECPVWAGVVRSDFAELRLPPPAP